MSEQERQLISALLPPWALLAVVVFVLLAYTLPRIAEASEALARLMGPVGRYWRDRGQRRDRRHQEELQKEAKQLAKQIVAEVQPVDYQEMGRQLENMDRRVRTLERSNEVQKAFIVYDAEWHFDDELSSVGHPDCKPAFRLTFDRFEALYEQGWRPGQELPPTPG